MPMRITGMSSGMDIDKIVSDLMKAERMPQVKLKQQKDLLNYQTSLYREINTKVSSLREALNAMRFSSGLTGTKATSSSGDISVSMNGSSSKSSYSLEVIALATNASISGGENVSNFGLMGNPYSDATIVQGVNDQMIVTLDNQAKAIKIPAGTYTVDEMKGALQTAINSQFGSNKVQVGIDGGNRLTLDPITSSGKKPQITVKEMNGALSALGFTDGQSYRLDVNMKLSDLAQSSNLNYNQPLQVPGEFKVNGVSITYDENSTIQSIMTKVNSSSANVNMSYDSVNNKFVFKSRQTGSTSELKLESVSGNFLEAIKVADGTANGTDAIVKIDNEEKTFSSNNFNYDGMSIQLNKVTSEAVTINVAADPDAVVDKVKKFVSSYNDLIELVNTRLGETRDRNYSPLTDDQRSAMNESDIATWESKVKIGLLHNSSILKNIKSSLRELLSKEVDGIADEFNTLSEVGITTAPYVRGDIKNAGKIVIDEAKLKNAISQNPEAVNALFTNNPGFESQEGIAVTMYKRVDNIMGSLIKEAGRIDGATNDVSTVIGKKVFDLESRIMSMNAILNKKEDNYYKRFSVMEKAIANGNAQMNWLAQQLG
ncbi:flagellar filament capping protein FliD [Paenibacillus sp. KQZ6P-2]|uniref:Flagellar hook-associated protein 2 n=1 Tax=Paenibacillus mangrovi TaxID=2931978 RepID=A0A9X2B2X7_9BACL|nr:flagellar filament capping protein FliD [Paenibacillus mangrovi]MCJ8012751.1 flagellar filament capping protein FliD [Paenibacillus mangrovi]